MDIGHGTLIAMWVTFGVASLSFWTRMLVQIILVKRLGIDDYLMLAAWILHTVCCAINTVSIRWGLGQHYVDLSLTSLEAVVKYHWLAFPFAALSPMLARISYIVLLLSLLALISQRRRQFVWILMLLQIVTNITFIIFAFCQCHPVEKLWSWTIPGKRWPTKIFKGYAYFQGAINSFTDLSGTVLAVTITYPLHLEPATKIVFMVMACSSILATVGSIMNTIYVQGLGTQDQSYTLCFLVIWYTVEINIIIITTSIPKLTPLFVKTHRIWQSKFHISK